MKIRNAIDGIYVHRKVLSDGSEVFDVCFGAVRLPAISEKDAEQLAETIDQAIRDTDEDVEIIFLPGVVLQLECGQNIEVMKCYKIRTGTF